MAQHGWTRFAVCVDHSLCTYMVDLGLLGKSSENDHAVSTRFFEDQLECALKTTKELVQHLITVDTIIAYSPKADTVAIFAPVRQKVPNLKLISRNFLSVTNEQFL